jgi:hypothetical protein
MARNLGFSGGQFAAVVDRGRSPDAAAGGKKANVAYSNHFIAHLIET